jgi:glycerol-1-phosphate dehydrogenase [NAD(P)+]
LLLKEVFVSIWHLPKIEILPFEEIDDRRSVCVVTTRAAFDAAGERIRHLNIRSTIDTQDASIVYWDSLIPQVAGDVIYALGGGLAVDTGKYLAVKCGLPLVSLPTALSVDAFLTWASGFRRDGCVYYMETKPPEQLIIDFDVLASAPPGIRAAGICDVLSIATGAWDWKFAEEHGQNPPHMRYIPYLDQTIRGVLQGAFDCAEAAGRGDHDGLKQLLDCLALEVQLCNLIGHSRPEEGSEHYFAYSVENVMGKGLPHGDLVGPGIILMAALQGQDIGPLLDAHHACNIPLTNIPAPVIEQTMLDLPAYCQRHKLAYGIAHTLTPEHLAALPQLA